MPLRLGLAKEDRNFVSLEHRDFPKTWLDPGGIKNSPPLRLQVIKLMKAWPHYSLTPLLITL
jgi:hypothetical protein